VASSPLKRREYNKQSMRYYQLLSVLHVTQQALLQATPQYRLGESYTENL